ncbi:Siderophore synthetase component [Prauserella aidingensis]|uniref:IucA/IucC family protein n=1 Tax=Prauserella aidingensis TaxID=387890 RepID=UPI0020A38007|nr:IucA/IucC family protein [Prauserella aidingensis]MCP2251913.1 Siderophore synthetase component [Prauserella aidingensis]
MASAHPTGAGRAADTGQPSDVVMADLLDTLIRERLCGFDAGTIAGEGDSDGGEYRIAHDSGCVRFRVRPGGALQPWRYAGGPVRHGDREVTAAELLRLVAAPEPPAEPGHDAADQDSAGQGSGNQGAADRDAVSRDAVDQVAADLDTAAAHAAVPADAGGIVGDPELTTAARGRPFHPTARAVVGWHADDLVHYGRSEFGLDWLAVRTGRLRFGDGAWDAAALPGAPSVADGETLVPVHPWHLDHVLRTEFAEEFAAGDVRVVARGTGRWRPTSSVRTLAPAGPDGTPSSRTNPDPRTNPSPRTNAGPRMNTGPQVKLPLGVNTLGSARMLPPRYLDNGQRGERLLRDVVTADPELSELVVVAGETSWCGWNGDPYADRPGLLAAQLRHYPVEAADAVPMGAFASAEHLAAHPVDPATFFRDIAAGFCAVAVGFLCHGVLPEIHGQNVLLAGDRFVLRDHDTVRYCPAWLSAPDPGYRVKPGARQSLRLDEPAELVGYLQTLGFQVNLHAIIDALSHHYDVPESHLWTQLRDVLEHHLERRATIHRRDPAVRTRIATVRGLLLDAPTWPSREVLRPLLHRGRSSGVSMPAATGTVPNPLAFRAPHRP